MFRLQTKHLNLYSRANTCTNLAIVKWFSAVQSGCCSWMRTMNRKGGCESNIHLKHFQVFRVNSIFRKYKAFILSIFILLFSYNRIGSFIFVIKCVASPDNLLRHSTPQRTLWCKVLSNRRCFWMAILCLCVFFFDDKIFAALIYMQFALKNTLKYQIPKYSFNLIAVLIVWQSSNNNM